MAEWATDTGQYPRRSARDEQTAFLLWETNTKACGGETGENESFQDNNKWHAWGNIIYSRQEM